MECSRELIVSFHPTDYSAPRPLTGPLKNTIASIVVNLPLRIGFPGPALLDPSGFQRKIGLRLWLHELRLSK